MYIWTLLNQLSRSCNYIGENSWYWKRKKISDIRWCQNHRLSEGFHPLFPESVLTSLFQLEKWQKRVFQVWLSMALWPKTCPPQAWDHLTLGKKKICCHLKNELVAATFVNLIFRTWNDDIKSYFCIVGTSWMGWGRVEWYWHMGMSYLTYLNPQLFKNIAYVGSFKHFSVQLFYTTRPSPSLTTVVSKTLTEWKSENIMNGRTNGRVGARDTCMSKNKGSDMPRCPWSSFIFLLQPIQGWEYNVEKYREAIIKEEQCKVPVESDWALYPLGIGHFPTNKKMSLEQMRKEYHEYCPKSKSNNIVFCPDQIIKRKKDKKLQWINDFFKNIEKKKRLLLSLT